MVSQYKIANYLIDFTRNQIIRDQHSEHEFIQTLPPKTILVLTELAKSPGQVISHEQLMNVVWQDTVVSPNSLQRCIAQLRKALGDDSKQQRIIKTHAKQGYSLELSVRFLQNSTKPATQPAVEHYDLSKKSASNANQTTSIDFDHNKSAQTQQAVLPKDGGNLPSRIMWSVSLIILVIITVKYFSATSRNFNFNTLTPITSSDNLERNASYSPDGKYILFHRYDGLCDNNIWAKEIATAKEHRLTSTYGFYSDHSFTENGDKLAFMAKVSCGKNKQNNKQKNKQLNKKQGACWNLMTLDFAKALKQPQQPELTVSCDQGKLANPIWLTNGNIAALNQQADRWQIVKFMPGAPSYVPLYTANDKNYYHLIYSSKQEQLIAIAINSLNEHVIDLISLQGELLSSHLIVRPEGLSPYQLIAPIIDPQQEQLIFSTGKRLFSLSFNGEIEQISTLNHNNLATIKMNYNGESIVTVQGVVDTDIAKVNLEHFNPNKSQRTDHNQALNFNQVHQPYPSLARSIAEDYDAQFQPKGEFIAFISTRSGTRQIWIKNEVQLSQLTDFPIDTIISSFRWEPSGASIIIAANDQLFKISLDKTVERIPLKFAVLNLYQWQENNELLLSVRQAGQPQLISYNLSSKHSTTLIKGTTNWAVKTELNQLLYLDAHYTFLMKTANKSQPIEKLKGQFGSSRFILENGNIYSINKQKQLWSYSPKTNDFQILGKMDKYTRFISDIEQSELLLTQIIAAKTEVVVLSNKLD